MRRIQLCTMILSLVFAMFFMGCDALDSNGNNSEIGEGLIVSESQPVIIYNDSLSDIEISYAIDGEYFDEIILAGTQYEIEDDGVTEITITVVSL